MSENSEIAYLQDFMAENICFGCGIHNPDGLQIKSFWQGEEMHCVWYSDERFQGWKGLMNGGVLATLIDCHSMATALAYAYKTENNRAWDSEPQYRYATGTMTVKYLKPTPNDKAIELIAKVLEVKGKKTTIEVNVWVAGEKTAEAQVIAIRVFESGQNQGDNPFAS